MNARRTFSLLAMIFFTPLLLGAASSSALNSDPDAMVISTSDIDLFWNVVDRAGGVPDAAAFKQYFDLGSPGVRGFIGQRLVSPGHLASVFSENKAYYLKARPNMAGVRSQIPRLRADLHRFKNLYPGARFPNLYFVVGALNSGGTSVDGIGEIVGTEMVSKSATDLQRIAPTAAHELMHYNQQDADTNDLLGSTIYEGTADFLAQLADGKNIAADQWRFGCTHEAALWNAFKRAMYTSDEKIIANWLFSMDAGPLGAPPFVGYWLGSRIVQSYYHVHRDKQATISAILHVKDYGIFLRDSGYPAGRTPCLPERRWGA